MQMIHCTYLISPDTNNTSVDDELSNIDRWASSNNLKLNKTKSQEMIVYSISKSKDARVLPKLLTDITRVNSIKILGVTFRNDLTLHDHVSAVCESAAQSLYA